MPLRSTVQRLPVDLRRRLDARLIRAGWGGFAAHAAWLAEQGHTVSVSALQRYAKRRRREAEAERLIEMIRVSTDEASALSEALSEQGVALAEASHHLMQEHLYRALRRLPPDPAPEDLGQVSRMHGAVTRAGAALRRERRADERTTADRVADVAARHGVSAEGIAAMRREIEGGSP